MRLAFNRFFGARPAAANLHFLEFTGDGGAQARQTAFHQIILGPRFHGFGRQRFVDASRHEKERNIKTIFFDEIERLEAAEMRKILVGDDDVPMLFGERNFHVGTARHPLENGVVAAPPQSVQQELGIVFRIFDDEET